VDLVLKPAFPKSLLLAGCALLLAGLAPFASALAQTTPAAAVGDPAERLSRYLRALAQNPQDLAMLTASGQAALELGDASGALGFYARAEKLAPKDGRVKAGLGSALVHLEQPKEALKLLDEAVDLGVPEADIASDRGLARDLRGDNRRAQADYLLALRAHPDAETTRRLALSQAIAGDRAAALVTLQPLLQRHDKGADRARAFVLALTGDTAGAEKAARDEMPAQQVAALAPFLARLSTLKAGQKAAAVHFGHFPSLGRRYTEAQLFAEATRDAQGVATPLADDDVSGDEEPVFRAAPPRAEAAPTTTARSRADAAREKAADAKTKAAKAKATTTAKAKAEAAAREKAEAKAKAAAPERYWVQVASGRNKADLGKAWQALVAKHAKLRGREAWTAPWRASHRLLTGPFKTAADAQDFVNTLAKTGFSTIQFTTRAGATVERVTTK